ncbi:MAG: hypothetical protein RL661_883 [Pseudomonadota bacterium]
MICWQDTETYSPVPIKHGVHAYAERVEVMLWAYAIDDGPVSVWDRTQVDDMPADLAAARANPECIHVFHNSQFDRTVLGWNGFDVPLDRTLDTMVMALEHSLPASLGQLCEVLRVPTDKAKDKDGKRLIHLFCQPRPKNVKLRRATAETHPIEWAKFVSYAGNDIEAMRECYKRLPKWNFK